MPGQTTNLILTEDQERKLVDYCIERVQSLKASNSERIEKDAFGWDAYENERADRKGGIWKQSKLVLPLTSMIVDAAVAKAEDDILDNEPFMKFTANGVQDETEAEDCNQYFRWKFGPGGANLKKTLQDGMLPVFLQRAAVFKVVHVDTPHEWLDTETPVLHQRDEAGNYTPVQTADSAGNLQFVSEDQAAWVERIDPITGYPETGGDGQPLKVLSTDPSVILDTTVHEFRKPAQGVLRSVTVYKGAKAVLVDSDSFLCPLNVPTIEQADFKAELYDKPISWVQGIYLDRPWLGWDGAKARFESQAEAAAKTKIERNQDGKEALDFDQETKTVQIIECWVKRDILGWGRPQEFMVLIEPESETALFYEFQAKLCPDMESPYVSISVSTKKGYWWGLSLPEKIKQYQDYVDLQFNRHSARNARNANPVGAMNPDAVKEAPTALKVGEGGLYTLKAGKSIHDFVQWAQIPNLDVDTQQLVDYVIYLVQKWLAISDIGQGDYSNLPQNSTKYGIQATQSESNKLNRRYGRRLIEGFRKIADKMVQLQRDQIDGEEVFEYMEGKETVLVSVSPDKVRRFRYNVTIEVGQHLTDDDVNASKQALEVQAQYFALPPLQQDASRPLFSKILERLGFKDTDRLLPVAQPMPVPTVPVQQPVEAIQ